MIESIVYAVHYISIIVGVVCFGLWFEKKSNKVLFWIMLVAFAIFLISFR